jgi:aldose 1-epimerase
VVLAAPGVEARVDLALGARVRSLRVRGRALLLEAPREPSPVPDLMYGSFLMAPWVGWLSRGELRWEGIHRFPPNLGPHAIHGLVASRPWELAAATDGTLEARVGLARAGWPFGGEAEQRFELRERSLRMVGRLRAGDRPFPAAVGWHPWFLRDGDPVVTVEAGETLELAGDRVPTGRRVPVDSRTDLRRGAQLGGRDLDDCYVAPRSPATVRWPDLTLTVSWGPTVAALVVFCTPYALCLEPQTAWPDAPTLHRRGVEGCGLAVLGPGEALEAWQQWSWDEGPGAERPGGGAGA